MIPVRRSTQDGSSEATNSSGTDLDRRRRSPGASAGLTSWMMRTIPPKPHPMAGCHPPCKSCALNPADAPKEASRGVMR